MGELPGENRARPHAVPQPHSLLEFPALAADLGYQYLQLTPHRDLIPFFTHPKADDELVRQLRKACADAGVEIASVLRAFSGGFGEIGFLDRDDLAMVSSVFAEDESAEEVSCYKRRTMREYVAANTTARPALVQDSASSRVMSQDLMTLPVAGRCGHFGGGGAGRSRCRGRSCFPLGVWGE